MNPQTNQSIQRRNDGSINADFYIERGLVKRSRKATELAANSIRWIARMWRNIYQHQETSASRNAVHR